MRQFDHRAQRFRYLRDPMFMAGAVIALILLAVLLYFAFRTPSSPGPVQTLSDRGAQTKTYFEGGAPVANSTEEENLRERLKEQGKMQGVSFVFDAKGFRKTDGSDTFRTSTMTQLEIDASAAGLPEGTRLTLSIPGADVHTMITTPGRYRYLVSFHKWGEQKMTLQGKGLPGGERSYTFQVR